MTRQTSAGPFSITTAPSLINCPKCHRPIMAATVRGLDEHLDTAMLNPMGELMALMEGRRTFDLRGDYIGLRNKEKIAAGHRDAPVVARHACKDVPREHLDPAWMEAAIAIVVNACGGVIVGHDVTPTNPPF